MASDNQLQKLIPPFRYAIVEEGVFRGAFPTERNCRFLRRLKLKTLISLAPKRANKVISGFCEQEGIIYRYFSVPKYKDDVPISSSQVVQILQLIIDPANLPLYIHCLDGSDVTGIVIMCLRKLQNWNLSTIFTEFSRFTRGNYITSVESEFVETFKAEIEIGPTIPGWLWQGVRYAKHPTFKLKLLDNTLAANGAEDDAAKGEKRPAQQPTTHTHHSHAHHTHLRTQFQSGVFSHTHTHSKGDFSRDIQALDLGVSTPPHPLTPATSSSTGGGGVGV